MGLASGAQLGRYRIIEQIGRGGMATVYRAYQAGLDRYVAIKVLPEFFADDEGFRERFRREAVAIARLRHPNILAVFDSGEDNGVVYLVAELVEGGTLTERLGRPLPLAEVTRILSAVASALDHAHGQGILHRDIKPSNVLLSRDGTPVLSDFGLAQMMDSLQRLSRSGTMVGTPEYMAPEHGSGDPIGPWTDLYALGVVAYEMLTGGVPFSAITPFAVVLAHMGQPLPMPKERNPALPDTVQTVLLKGLAKRPEDRYSSASEMARALQAAVDAADARSSATTQPGAFARPHSGSLASAARAAGRVAAQAARSPRRLFLGAVVLMVLAAVLLTARAMLGPVADDSQVPFQSDPGALALLQVGAADATSAGTGVVLLADDFDNTDSGWLRRSSADPSRFFLAYFGGKYNIRRIDPQFSGLAGSAVPGSYADTTIAVDAQIESEVAGAHVALTCRTQTGSGSGYRLKLDPGVRGVQLQRRDAGTLIPISDVVLSDVIRGGTAHNRLQLSCVGATISARVNGVELLSVQDSSYAEGVHLLSIAGGNAPYSARFDNLVVS